MSKNVFGPSSAASTDLAVDHAAAWEVDVARHSFLTCTELSYLVSASPGLKPSSYPLEIVKVDTGPNEATGASLARARLSKCRPCSHEDPTTLLDAR
jgi:hypothetical protein